MNCPVCNQPMKDVTVPRITSGFVWERYQCEPCKIIARVEITYTSYDEPAKATGVTANGRGSLEP